MLLPFPFVGSCLKAQVASNLVAAKPTDEVPLRYAKTFVIPPRREHLIRLVPRHQHLRGRAISPTAAVKRAITDCRFFFDHRGAKKKLTKRKRRKRSFSRSAEHEEASAASTAPPLKRRAKLSCCNRLPRHSGVRYYSPLSR